MGLAKFGKHTHTLHAGTPSNSQARSSTKKTVFKKKRRKVLMENIVRFYCENGGFRNVRVQNENLSWSKIRALARGVSPAPKARGAGPTGEGRWGFRA